MYVEYVGTNMSLLPRKSGIKSCSMAETIYNYSYNKVLRSEWTDPLCP